MKQIDYENIAKRMIALNSIGGYIVHYDGHRGLWWTDTAHEDDMYQIAQRKKVELPRSKRYGGVLSILDAVDEFLPKIGYYSLLEIYEQLDSMRENPNDLILEEEYLYG